MAASIILVCIIFALFIVLIMYSCVRISARDEKIAQITYRQMMAKKEEHDKSIASDLFCLASNKPVKVLDFEKMTGCSPEKCVYCSMSAFLDLD